MEGPEFRRGLLRLDQLEAAGGPVALVCAEAVWWRCHRALIADFLKASGVEIVHIIDAQKVQLHPFTSAARLVEGKLSYRDDKEK